MTHLAVARFVAFQNGQGETFGARIGGNDSLAGRADRKRVWTWAGDILNAGRYHDSAAGQDARPAGTPECGPNSRGSRILRSLRYKRKKQNQRGGHFISFWHEKCNDDGMRYTWVLLIWLAIVPLGHGAQNEKTGAKTQVITGCLDEKPGIYVLRTDTDLKEIAQLEPVGFEKQLFARFVGHRVSVSGTLIESTEPPTLRVSSIASVKDISETCTPAASK